MYASAKQSRYGNREWLIHTTSGLRGVKECIEERQGERIGVMIDDVAMEHGWEVGNVSV